MKDTSYMRQSIWNKKTSIIIKRNCLNFRLIYLQVVFIHSSDTDGRALVGRFQTTSQNQQDDVEIKIQVIRFKIFSLKRKFPFWVKNCTYYFPFQGRPIYSIASSFVLCCQVLLWMSNMHHFFNWGENEGFGSEDILFFEMLVEQFLLLYLYF